MVKLILQNHETEKDMIVTARNRLMNLGISKEQHLYLRTKQFNLKQELNEK